MQRSAGEVRCDFEDVSGVGDAWIRVMEALGGKAPDLVVLNAGVCLNETLLRGTDADNLRIFQVNVLSPLAVARHAAASWNDSHQRGHLIFVGSQAALPGARQTGAAAYAASKGAVHALVGPLAAELGPAVRVNAVAPGDVATANELALVTRGCSGPLRSDAIRASARRSPLGRWVTPEEVAQAVLFLDRCEGMNAAILNVSGGTSAG